MADLSIDFAGIKSPNPFWLASAPPANTGDQVMRAFDAGWGGAVWKTLGDPIVNVSSQYGLVGGAGFPAYAAAKAGVIGLTRAMAVDHAPDGIRVNCVCPGPIETPMLSADSAETDLARRERERVRNRLLLGRIGQPEDVAALVAFLLSDQAKNMTGSVIATDGGWTAG